MATVLLIEPHPETARTYAETLERAGLRVETAANSDGRSDGLAPDVVVISVPSVEQSLVRIVAHGRTVPRIVLSSEPADADRAAELDCAAVLIRPVMYDDLVKEVRRSLKAAAAEQPA